MAPAWRRHLSRTRLTVYGALLSVGCFVLSAAFTWGIWGIESQNLRVEGEYCPAIPADVPLEMGAAFEFGLFPPSIWCSLSSNDDQWGESLTSYPVLPNVLFWIAVACAAAVAVSLIVPKPPTGAHRIRGG